MEDSVPLLGVVALTREQPVDAVLEAVARLLEGQGFAIAGFVQRELPGEGGCCPETQLEEIATGRRVRISQALGSGSRGCRLDPQALAGLAGELLASLENRPDILVLNRFGKGESEGQGFRAVLERACELQIPVLTAVKDTYTPAWQAFAGDFAEALPADVAEIAIWCRKSIDASRGKRHAA